jgi:ABC-type transport system involved in multi-copper enzyme maturation permease subunit
MNRYIKIALIAIGALLLLNGVGNMLDDSRILTYDITSVLAGVGFVLIGLSNKRHKD